MKVNIEELQAEHLRRCDNKKRPNSKKFFDLTFPKFRHKPSTIQSRYKKTVEDAFSRLIQ